MRSKRETKRKPKRYCDGQSSDSESMREGSDNESGSEFNEDDDDDDRCSTPESQKDTKCSVCSRNVTSSDKSLQCDKCNEWCHIKCGGVTKEHYRQMVQLDESNIEIQWLCPPCEQLQQPSNNSVVKPSRTDQPAAVTTAQQQPPRKAAFEKLSVPASDPSDLSTKAIKPTQPAASVNPVPPTAVVSPRLILPAPAAVLQPATVPPVAAGMIPPKHTVVEQNGSTNGVGGALRSIVAARPVVGVLGVGGGGRLAFPDMKIRDLPFFPVLATLLRPCGLTPKEDAKVRPVLEAQTQNLAFYLTQEQANTVNNGRRVEANGMVVYKMHILLRFTALAPDSVHDDHFPKNLCLKVNNKICPLPNPKPVPANRPNMEAKRPPKPLIITSLCKLNTKSCLNQVTISWSPSEVQHTVSIYLVEKLSPADLLGLLKSRGQRDPEITKALIRSKLEDHDSDEIATTSCKVTMSCPLGMARMTYPTRASTCDHLQCFDADTYLRMNEKKPKWLCPVCNRPAYFEALFLDGFYIQLLQSPKFRALATHDIVLNQDATWEPVVPEGGGVAADSDDDDDDYGDPLMLPNRLAAAGGTAAAHASSDNSEVIPIGLGGVDADGAPILSQLAMLPISTARVPLATNGALPTTNGIAPALAESSPGVSLPAGKSGDIDVDDDDVLRDRHYAPEDDFADWNFSVKFFRFIRVPPSRSGTPTPLSSSLAAAVTGGGSGLGGDASEGEEENRPSKPVPRASSRGGRRGGGAARGRKPRGGGGGGGARKRPAGYSSGDSDEDSPVERARPAKGRGRGRGRGARGGGASTAPKRSRYRDTSEEEEVSESLDSDYEQAAAVEAPTVPVRANNRTTAVVPPAATSASGRPSRNCRRSTNYAELEAGDDVLDYLLGN